MSSDPPAKLEPFLLISKSAKGSAAAKLIQDATSAPGLFVFAELLDQPNIRQLANTEHAPYHDLLELFSYRTFQDYLEHKDSLPPLNTAQTTKLKHLSLVSLSMDSHILPYPQLLQALQMPSIRDLEDLIIDAIYLDLLRGKLDQKQQQLEVEYTLGRDLAPGKIDALLAALQDWAQTTSSALTTLDAQLSSLASTHAAAKAHLAEHDRLYADTLKSVSEKAKSTSATSATTSASASTSMRKPLAASSSSTSASFADDRMDVDEPSLADVAKARNRKPVNQSDAAKLPRKRNRF